MIGASLLQGGVPETPVGAKSLSLPSSSPPNGPGGGNLLRASLIVDESFMLRMKEAGDILGEAAARRLTTAVDSMKKAGGIGGGGPGGTLAHGLRTARQWLNTPPDRHMPGLRELHQVGQAASMGGQGMALGAAASGNPMLAAGSVLLSGGGLLLKAAAKLAEVSDRVREEQRRFAYISPSLAGNYQQADARRMLRDMQTGENISGSNRRLQEALDKIADKVAPVFDAITNLKNNIMAVILEKINAVLEWAMQLFPALKAFLERRQPQNFPWIDRFDRMAQGAEINRNLRNGLRPAVGGRRP